MAPSHHEPLKALAALEWESVPPEKLPSLLSDTFTDAQTIIDSLPVPATVQAAAASGQNKSTRRARSHTDPVNPSVTINNSLSTRQSGAALKLSQDLMKEWKEVKVNARDNPLSINVWKLAAKDGKGSWFARRSVHDGLTFEKWKLGLEREFLESMKVQTGPGGGSIRGIGADKRVEHHVCDSAGKAEVFQLSAQFPGPTAPRDFITLLLTAEQTHTPPNSSRPLRTFMIVSKPCEHPECPPRQGYIRGQYESVEIIREVPSDKPAIRRARSSIDFSADKEQVQSKAEHMGKEAVLRAAKNAAASQMEDGRDRGMSTASVDSAPARDDAAQRVDGAADDEDEVPTTIEWLMITRSDPGGNVPRFMIERGTPGGIVGDASKFLKWLTTKAARDFAPESETGQENDNLKSEAMHAEEEKTRVKGLAPAPTSNLVSEETRPREAAQMFTVDEEAEGPPYSNGLYGIISGAFGIASSAVAGRLPNNLPGFFNSNNNSSNDTLAETIKDEDEDDSIGHESDTSSIRSFASAVEGNGTPIEPTVSQPVPDETTSIHSTSNESHGTRHLSHHEKELRKLEDRRKKMHDKMARLQTRMASKKTEDSQKDAAATAKLREKHEREMAKHEQKYQRELRRLEQKREGEERKAEQRRHKQAERQEKANLSLELERVRVERDLALKQADALKAQVGELQAQNTRLVAEIGRTGNANASTIVRRESTMSASGMATPKGPAKGSIQRATTSV